ncbi:MAG: WcaF family extracellular polysaccharide biosynthesis acetyltransferase [Terracidiphilus sp.]|jgi:putative colanic acid biosynthesis acetyltransferase WcaF
MQGRIQDLSKFKVPSGFRGRPAWFVQLWWLVEMLLFHPSPQVMFGWRRFLLRIFGAKIGKGVLIRRSATVTYPWRLTIGNWCWVGDHATLYTLGEITIDENTVISHHAYLCTASHDYTRPTFDQFAKPIHVESEAWIATSAYVGPGVTIGQGAVVGACSVVLKDVPANIVCAGNPLKVLRARVAETK